MFISVPFSHSVMSDSCYPMNCSMPGLPVHHQLLEFIHAHMHTQSVLLTDLKCTYGT